MNWILDSSHVLIMIQLILDLKLDFADQKLVAVSWPVQYYGSDDQTTLMRYTKSCAIT
jgi:hypothetical protein